MLMSNAGKRIVIGSAYVPIGGSSEWSFLSECPSAGVG